MSLLLRKRIWNSALRHLYSTFTTGYFTSLYEFYQLVEDGQLAKWIDVSNKNTTIELMVHPGNQLCASENRILESGWIKEYAATLTNYRDVMQKRK